MTNVTKFVCAPRNRPINTLNTLGICASNNFNNFQRYQISIEFYCLSATCQTKQSKGPYLGSLALDGVVWGPYGCSVPNRRSTGTLFLDAKNIEVYNVLLLT